MPGDVRVAVKGRAFSLNQTDHAQGHILPDVEAWLRLGIGGLRAQVLAARARVEQDTSDAETQRSGGSQREENGETREQFSALSLPLRASASKSLDERLVFYDAALIALQAAHEFMLRYADLATELARDSDDPARVQELAHVAANCRWLAEQPARDFHEALQAVGAPFGLLQNESCLL